MKKLVLTLLLAMPYCMYGSEQKTVAEDGVVEIRRDNSMSIFFRHGGGHGRLKSVTGLLEDSCSCEDSRAELFKLPNLWAVVDDRNIKLLPQNFFWKGEEYRIGVDDDYLSIGALRINDTYINALMHLASYQEESDKEGIRSFVILQREDVDSEIQAVTESEEKIDIVSQILVKRAMLQLLKGDRSDNPLPSVNQLARKLARHYLDLEDSSDDKPIRTFQVGHGLSQGYDMQQVSSAFQPISANVGAYISQIDDSVRDRTCELAI